MENLWSVQWHWFHNLSLASLDEMKMAVPKEVIDDYNQLMGRSPRTMISIECFHRIFWGFVKKKSADDVTVEDVMAFLNDGMQNKKWKPSTVKQYARYCQAFLTQFRDESFMRKLKRALRNLPKFQKHAGLAEGLYISPDKIDLFISKASDEEWAVLYTMILKWGLRLNEAINLAPNDIDVVKNRVIVHGKGLGGMHKIRQVLVEKSTITRVLKFAGCSQEQINGGKQIRDATPIIKTIKARNAEYKWKETAKKVGLKNWAKLTPHDGRHSYAIDFLLKRRSQGMAALVLLKNQLGHTNLNITSIYLDIAGGEAQDIFDSGVNNTVEVAK